MPGHGITRYIAGCRCDTCKTVSAAWRQQRGDDRKKQRVLFGGQLIAPLPTELHGRMSTYTNWFCRCRDCVAASSAYRRAHRKARS